MYNKEPKYVYEDWYIHPDLVNLDYGVLGKNIKNYEAMEKPINQLLSNIILKYLNIYLIYKMGQKLFDIFSFSHLLGGFLMYNLQFTFLETNNSYNLRNDRR